MLFFGSHFLPFFDLICNLFFSWWMVVDGGGWLVVVTGRWAIGRWADGPSADGRWAIGRWPMGHRPMGRCAIGRWPMRHRPTADGPPPSFSFGTRRFQKNMFFQFRKCYFNASFKFFVLFLGLGTLLKSSTQRN